MEHCSLEKNEYLGFVDRWTDLLDVNPTQTKALVVWTVYNLECFEYIVFLGLLYTLTIQKYLWVKHWVRGGLQRSVHVGNVALVQY